MGLQVIQAISMNADLVSLSDEVLQTVKVRRAIAEAQSTCTLFGRHSRACETSWDHALTLQVPPLGPKESRAK